METGRVVSLSGQNTHLNTGHMVHATKDKLQGDSVSIVFYGNSAENRDICITHKTAVSKYHRSKLTIGC